MLRSRSILLVFLVLIIFLAGAQDQVPERTDAGPEQAITFSEVPGDSTRPSTIQSVEVAFRLEDFEKNYSDRTYFYVQYGRKIGAVDAFLKVLRYTLGTTTAYQIESDTYWKFKKQGYGYFNAAYSDNSILPNYRIRAEVFQNYKRWEYSMGAGIIKPHNFREIPLITGTIGYYFSDYFVYARPSFSYVDNGFTKSIFIQGRKYFTKTNFIALSLLKGADTGVNRNINAVANSFGSDVYLVRANGQMKTGTIKLGAGLDYGGIWIPEAGEYARYIGVDLFVNLEF